MRKTFLNPALAAACGLWAGDGVGAELHQGSAAYPSRPVTLIVPSAGGGGTDTVARVMAAVLGRALGQSFVVDNRPGANGILGASLVAKAPADGHRLLFTYAAVMAINPGLYPRLPYDPFRDFVAVAQIGNLGSLLVVRKDLPVNSLQDFVAYARSRPGRLNYCSWGTGSGGHLTMEGLKKQAGLALTHVAYKGSSHCAQDVMAGLVDAGFADVANTVGLVRAGRLKALAYSGGERIRQLPQVPTLTETGYPFNIGSWYGVFAPAGTPPAIVGRLHAEIQRALRQPAVVQRLHELHLTDLPQGTPTQFTDTLRRDSVLWRRLIQESGTTLE